MGYSIGDKVRIIRSPIPARIGVIATVISDLTEHCSCGLKCGGGFGHHLDLQAVQIPGKDYSKHALGGACAAFYEPDCLEPYYDGNELSSWETLKDIYNPHKQKVV
jgi:hypothetical protein